MDPSSRQTPFSAPHVEVPLITIIGEKRAESTFGSHWEVAESDIEGRPLLIFERKDEHNVTRSKHVEIRSHLQKAMRQIMDGYLGLSLDTYPLVFRRPFTELVHRSDAIFNYVSEDPHESSALAQLKYFMSIELRDSLQTFRLARTQNHHTFDDLWTAYVSGELVFERHRGFISCYQIIGCIPPRSNDDWVVEHKAWDYDANAFGFKHSKTRISRFHGAQHGTQLKLVPARSLPSAEWESIKADCISRGHIWFQLQAGNHHFNYGAMAGRIDTEAHKLETTYVRGRVIVDTHAFYERNPSLIPELKRAGRIAREDLPQQHCSLTEEQALLAPPYLGGMSLDKDKWGYFLIDNLKAIDWVPTLWDNLELESVRKGILLDLVDGYDPSKYGKSEKGRGLVVFLMGPPGSGKTLTVESLAEFKRRPLYKTSPSQWKDRMHIDPENDFTPEEKFRSIFRLAHRWNAILMMDEADSIISQSDHKPPALQGDMKIFSIIKVYIKMLITYLAFLREVETYRGIAFLTSNMDRNIDEAVQSRLTATLQYHHPNQSQAQKAWWKVLRNSITNPDEAVEIAVRLSNTWDLDYRQINAGKLLADTIAEARGQPLTQELIDTALAFKGEKPRRSMVGVETNGISAEAPPDDKFEGV
ncbi:hypothetical protein ACLMJK_007821 [Lecanora helva]